MLNVRTANRVKADQHLSGNGGRTAPIRTLDTTTLHDTITYGGLRGP